MVLDKMNVRISPDDFAAIKKETDEVTQLLANIRGPEAAAKEAGASAADASAALRDAVGF